MRHDAFGPLVVKTTPKFNANSPRVPTEQWKTKIDFSKAADRSVFQNCLQGIKKVTLGTMMCHDLRKVSIELKRKLPQEMPLSGSRLMMWCELYRGRPYMYYINAVRYIYDVYTV